MSDDLADLVGEAADAIEALATENTRTLRRICDISGNGYHATQSNVANQPLAAGQRHLPSPLGPMALFQDYNGTIPVTEPGQPVGMLASGGMETPEVIRAISVTK